MPDVSIPSAHAFAWPVLQAVRHLGGSATVPEITEKVAVIAALTEEQQGVPRPGSGRTEVEYRLAWARTKLKLLGLLENSARGVWAVTDTSHGVGDAATIDALYKAFKMSEKKAPQPVDLSEETEPTDAELVDFDGWRDQLLGSLLTMAPDAFERLAQRLLREAGFVNVTVLGGSGDGGIDGVGTYRQSLISWPVYFQCKRYAKSVGSGAVRDFRGAMSGRGEKGLLITTATFTADAKSEATRDGAPPVDLIDGERLCNLLRDYNLGVRATPRTVIDVTVDPSFFLSI